MGKEDLVKSMSVQIIQRVELTLSNPGERTQLRQVKDGDYFIATEMAVMDRFPLPTHVGDYRLATVCWKVTKDRGVEFGAMKRQDGLFFISSQRTDSLL